MAKTKQHRNIRRERTSHHHHINMGGGGCGQQPNKLVWLAKRCVFSVFTGPSPLASFPSSPPLPPPPPPSISFDDLPIGIGAADVSGGLMYTPIFGHRNVNRRRYKRGKEGEEGREEMPKCQGIHSLVGYQQKTKAKEQGTNMAKSLAISKTKTQQEFGHSRRGPGQVWSYPKGVPWPPPFLGPKRVVGHSQNGH